DGPSSALFLDPTARNRVIQKVNPATGATTSSTANYFSGNLPTFDPVYGSYNFFQGYMDDVGDRIRQWRGYLQGEYEFAGGHTLTVTAASNRQRTDSQGNGYLRNRPTLAGAYVYDSISPSETNDDSIELRLASPQHQPIRYAAGLYYLNLRTNGLPGKTYYVSPSATTDLYTAGATSYSGTRDKSAFAALYADPFHNVTISAELRYQEEEAIRQSTAYTTVSLAAFNAGTATPVLNPAGAANLSGKFKAWVPRINIQYRFTPDANIYATFSKGNNPGGFNTSPYRQADQTLVKEEELFNYEVGFKARLGKLSIDAAAYYMDWKNQQTTGTFYAYCTSSGTSCLTEASGTSSNAFIYSITQNLGRTHVKGAEADATWETPIRGLSLRDGLSYNDPKYKSFCSANAAALYQTSTTPPYNCLAVDGNSLESISKWQNSLNADYEAAISTDWTFFARGDWQFQSKWYESELNLATSPAFSIFNARVGVHNDSWTLEFYGKNLSNSDHPYRLTRASDAYAGVSNLTNQNVAFVPRVPRQFGVRAAMKF
ncbi:TonB-dependent receptor, partial [Jatrophihabitans sp.]|uniref:TonB-dependent receptor n=1 Tax=Jatrophihabitans sp. TaxID=1932789 RepID=UPI0030C70AE0|nr:TonB-dependent receptor [Jatrophihabitans sp.]